MTAIVDAISAAIDLLLTRVGAATVVAATRRTAIAALPAAAAALLAAAAIGCITAAIWIAAIPHVGMAGAALCAAAVLLAGAGGMALIAHHLNRPIAPRVSPAPSADALVAEGIRLFQNHKGVALAAALVAGLCAGNETKAGRR